MWGFIHSAHSMSLASTCGLPLTENIVKYQPCLNLASIIFFQLQIAYITVVHILQHFGFSLVSLTKLTVDTVRA